MPQVALERENANHQGASLTLACGTGAEQLLDVYSRNY
jgi:hypothetical protein